MARTRIRLDKREYVLAKIEAKSLGIPVGEFVRRSLREALPPQGGGPWMKFAGFVDSGNTRASQSVDEIAYGRKE
jgi:hypothetical protein